jgi:hypothetical protein
MRKIKFYLNLYPLQQYSPPSQNDEKNPRTIKKVFPRDECYKMPTLYFFDQTDGKIFI